jgi:hypothetical protein
MQHETLKSGQPIAVQFVFGNSLSCRFIKDYEDTILVGYQASQDEMSSRMIYKKDIQQIHRLFRVK